MNKNNLVVDTDPGVDDAIAIMYLLKSGVNISGITTVFGNSVIENTTKNALKILEILGKNVDVYKGEANPIKVKPILAKSHGEGGFGGYDIDLKIKEKNITAVSFLINLLEKDNNITIICLGPTTNIAKLSIVRPDLVKNIGKLIILGGVLSEEGNISKYAEFNVYNDPDAFKIVLSLKTEKCLIPIDVCRKVYFTLKDFDNIKSSNLSSNIKKITKQYIDYYTTNKSYGGFKGGVMYDLLATIFYTNPELFSFKEIGIDVITNGENIGETIEVSNIEKKCKVIIGVEIEKLKYLFFKTMNYE